MKTKAKTVPEYLKSLPPERREAITALRGIILKNLPKGYQESLNWGMITYEIPLKVFPQTYNGQPLMYAGLASQKNHMAMYLMCAYADKAVGKWFQEAWKTADKKLDMGKSCLRFKKLSDLSLPVIGKLIAKTPMAEYIRYYERSRK